MRKPGVVKYYVGRGKTKRLVELQYKHGYYGSDNLGSAYTFYTAGDEKVRVPERQMLRNEKERIDDEWHKLPYREEVAKLKEVELQHAYEYDGGHYVDLPKGAEQVWEFTYLSHHSFVVELTDGAMLCLLNNKPIELRDTTFRDALKRLFKGKEITLLVPTVQRDTFMGDPK